MMMMMMMLRVMTVVSNLRDAPRPAERRPGRARDGRGGIVRGYPPLALALALALAPPEKAPPSNVGGGDTAGVPGPNRLPRRGGPGCVRADPAPGDAACSAAARARAMASTWNPFISATDSARAIPPPTVPCVVPRAGVSGSASSIVASSRGARCVLRGEGVAAALRDVAASEASIAAAAAAEVAPAAALLDQGSHVPRDAFAERSLGDDSPRGFDEGVQEVRRGARGDAGAEPRRPARAMRGELLDVGAVRQQIQRHVRQKRRGRPGGSIGRGGLVIGTRRVERDAGDRGVTGG